MLTRYEDDFAQWPDRYLLVYNAIMSGDLPLARRQHALLPDPTDPRWVPTRDRQRRMLERAASAEPVSPLDVTDLRGWQFVMGGTILGTLSPFGFGAGMTGRYAWLQDSYGQCLEGLLRLRALLDAAEVRPGRCRSCPTATAGSSVWPPPRCSAFPRSPSLRDGRTPSWSRTT